jgi:hypothetical protein
MDILVWILVAIVFLAIMGLGWKTFFEGVKKGAERILTVARKLLRI